MHPEPDTHLKNTVMKNQNAFILLLLACIAASCTEHDYREWVGKRTIRRYLSTESIDRYRPLAFSSLDSAFTAVEDMPEYQQANAIATLATWFYRSQDLEPQEEAAYRHAADSARQVCDSIEAAFLPTFIGWKMQHIYTSRHPEKGRVANKYTFYFDKRMSRMVHEEMTYRELMLSTYKREPDFYGLDW